MLPKYILFGFKCQVFGTYAGVNAYPIVSLTWILAYPESKPGVKETLRYMLSEKAQATSDSLGYVPLPESLRQKSLAAVDTIK